MLDSYWGVKSEKLQFSQVLIGVILIRSRIENDGELAVPKQVNEWIRLKRKTWVFRAHKHIQYAKCRIYVAYKRPEQVSEVVHGNIPVLQIVRHFPCSMFHTGVRSCFISEDIRRWMGPYAIPKYWAWHYARTLLGLSQLVLNSPILARALDSFQLSRRVLCMCMAAAPFSRRPYR